MLRRRPQTEANQGHTNQINESGNEATKSFGGTKMKLFKNFKNDESGAVTVDWVVLTAAIVGLGIAVLAAVSDGISNLSDDIDTQLSGQAISTSF